MKRRDIRGRGAAVPGRPGKRRGRDSNPREAVTSSGFRDRYAYAYLQAF
jgi:hypothetical protein